MLNRGISVIWVQQNLWLRTTLNHFVPVIHLIHLSSKFTLNCLLWENGQLIKKKFPLPTGKIPSFVNRGRQRDTAEERRFFSLVLAPTLSHDLSSPHFMRRPGLPSAQLWQCQGQQHPVASGFPLGIPWSSFVMEYLQWGTSLVAQLIKSLPAIQETLGQSLGWEDPLEKGLATHSSIVA